MCAAALTQCSISIALRNCSSFPKAKTDRLLVYIIPIDTQFWLGFIYKLGIFMKIMKSQFFY